jgi:adenylate cyclase
VGINLGDVIIDGDDIHGDGVNVAARLEGLADAGGVCVSRVVHEQVRDKLELAFEDLGEQQVKNIARPVHVFRVALSTAAAAAPARPALALPDKPSIAVLPFQNMSGDPEQEYFADGVVEDITTALSYFPRLFVIARNSSFTYKGRPGIDVRHVGRELGVRYVLEGSVRRAGDRVRITGQLVDAGTGAHLWADRFDGVLADIFDLQDTVARSVVGAIEPRLMSAEVERAKRKLTASLDAYDLYLRALPHYYAMTRDGIDAALALLRNALAIDPQYAVAAGLAASCYLVRATRRWQVNPDAERRIGLELGHRALASGANDPEALAMGGHAIAVSGGELREGLAAIERAITLNPNSALAHRVAGWVQCYLGEPSRAVGMFERAMLLSPREPMAFLTHLGMAAACLFQQDYDEAVSWARRAVDQNPNYTSSLRFLAAALGHLGRIEEAHAVVTRLLSLAPNDTIAAFAATAGIRFSGGLPLMLDGLRKAGLPE